MTSQTLSQSSHHLPRFEHLCGPPCLLTPMCKHIMLISVHQRSCPPLFRFPKLSLAPLSDSLAITCAPHTAHPTPHTLCLDTTCCPQSKVDPKQSTAHIKTTPVHSKPHTSSCKPTAPYNRKSDCSTPWPHPGLTRSQVPSRASLCKPGHQRHRRPAHLPAQRHAPPGLRLRGRRRAQRTALRWRPAAGAGPAAGLERTDAVGAEPVHAQAGSAARRAGGGFGEDGRSRAEGPGSGLNFGAVMVIILAIRGWMLLRSRLSQKRPAHVCEGVERVQPEHMIISR